MTGDLQQAYLDRAHRTLRTARVVLEAGDAESATNRAYYACFYAAQAALRSVGDAPKTHSGTHVRFALHFVATELVSVHIGSTLTTAFAARQRSDYDVSSVTDGGAAADLLGDAEVFIEAVAGVIEG